MRKMIALFFLTVLLTAPYAVAAEDIPQQPLTKYPQISEILSKTYPQLKFTGINKTDIQGLYEIEIGSNVVYFYPETTLMVFGEILTKTGVNLTAQSRARIATNKIKDLPLSKALKIGEGRNIVIEFTDPDCPYCRKASEFLKGRKDTTRYVFFAPLPSHNDAESKVKYILCSEDKAHVYEEVMAGKYDGRKLETCQSEQVASLAREHKQIAQNTGIVATPSFWINGEAVSGANIPMMEKLLSKSK